MPLNDDIYSVSLKITGDSSSIYIACESRKLHPKEWEFGKIYKLDESKYIMLIPKSDKIHGQAYRKMQALGDHIRAGMKASIDAVELKDFELDLEEWNQMVRQRRKNANRLPKIS